jgi:hypothetical protein
MRVQLRMNYEINRQLQRDSDLSVADYHVLNASGVENRGIARAVQPPIGALAQSRFRLCYGFRLAR